MMGRKLLLSASLAFAAAAASSCGASKFRGSASQVIRSGFPLPQEEDSHQRPVPTPKAAAATISDTELEKLLAAEGTPTPFAAQVPVPKQELVKTWQVEARKLPVRSHVYLLVDNSESMSIHQEQLAQGMGSLIDSLKGFDVNFSLHTTTEMPNAGSYAPNFTLPDGTTVMGAFLKWFYGVGFGDKAANALSFGLFKKLDSGELSPWKETEFPATLPIAVWKIVPTKSLFPTTSGILSLRPGSSESEIAEVKSALSLSIAKLGTRGSVHNSPLCTLARQLEKEHAKSLFQDAERAVFVFVTDDDQTAPNCYSQIEEDVVVNSKNTFSLPLKETWFVFEFEKPCDNGSSQWCRAPWYQKIVADCRTNPLCNSEYAAYGQVACTPEQRSFYKQWFEAEFGTALAEGKLRYAPGDRCWAITDDYPRVAMTTEDLSVTCQSASFTHRGSVYQGFHDYFRRNFPNSIFPDNGVCKVRDSGSFRDGVQRWVSMVPETTDASVIANTLSSRIVERATAIFGASGFSIASIANDSFKNPMGCNVLPDLESKKIIDLVKKGPTPDSRFSICDADYSKSLARVRSFLTEVPDQSKTLDLPQKAALESIKWYRGDELVKTLGAEDFIFQNGELKVTAAGVRINDLFEISAGIQE